MTENERKLIGMCRLFILACQNFIQIIDYTADEKQEMLQNLSEANAILDSMEKEKNYE